MCEIAYAISTRAHWEPIHGDFFLFVWRPHAQCGNYMTKRTKRRVSGAAAELYTLEWCKTAAAMADRARVDSIIVAISQIVMRASQPVALCVCMGHVNCHKQSPGAFGWTRSLNVCDFHLGEYLTQVDHWCRSMDVHDRISWRNSATWLETTGLYKCIVGMGFHFPFALIECSRRDF